MSNHLSQSMRDRLCIRILQHRFGQQDSAQRKKEDALFQALYHAKLGAHDLKLIATLPAGWLPGRQTFKVDPGPGEDYIRITGSTAMRCPLNEELSAPLDSLPKRLKARVLKFHKERETSADAKSGIRREVRHALRSFRTIPALRKGWPEAAQFLDDNAGEKDQLPAVRMDQLNKKLGLAS